MNIHSQKFKDDFGAYFQDLEISTNDHIKFHKIRNNNLDFFKKVYPLYVLLESLSNFRYFIDPSKKILVYQYAKAGKKDHFVEAARTLFNNDPKSQVLRKGILEETFTPYYVELYSDGLMLLNQFYLNNYRGCYLMIRCILEDLYRHIYYKDHKEEFLMVQTGISEYDLKLGAEYFRNYLRKASFLNELNQVDTDFNNLDGLSEEEIKKKNKFFNLNDELYRKTSAFVHGTNETYLSKFTSNSELEYNKDKADSLIEEVGRVINLIVLFLICAHYEHFSKFNEYEKSLILFNFEIDKRSKLRRFLNI